MKNLLSLFLFATLFTFSCTSVDIPNDLPLPETYFCVYTIEERCEAVSSLDDCSGNDKYVSSICPSSFSKSDDDSGEHGDEEEPYVSPTRCKDNDGNYYFCQWRNSGCFAIDINPEYSQHGACEPAIEECIQWGNLFINSSDEGEGLMCDGIRI